MFNDVSTFLKILFTNGETQHIFRQPLEFEWWLIRRKGRPFLLLPTSAANARTALELYSAQRLHAKFLRAILPALLKTPLAFLLPRVRIKVDADSALMQFMAQQSGVPVEKLRAPAIKVGGLAVMKARCVLLLCDEAGRPNKVVKVGLNPQGWVGLHPDGWKATEQEADHLELLPPHIIGCIRMTGRISSPALTAFATTFFPGESPRDDEGMEQLFHSWMNPHAPVLLEELRSWRELATEFYRVDPPMWQVLSHAVAGKKVHSTLQHGDFAPWNIRAASQQNLQVFDWERGDVQGIPGWDWFHFFVQTAMLARRHSEKRVAAEVEQLFQSPRFRIYAAAARITDIVRPLFLAYLLHQKWVVKPVEGGATAEKLYELLVVRWRLKPSVPAIQLNGAKPVKNPKPTVAVTIQKQLRFALSQLSNLFWEPTLAAIARPTMRAKFREHWKLIVANFVLLAALTGFQFLVNQRTDSHLSFIPFYLFPCVWLAFKVDRRWAALAATVAAIVSPLLRHLQSPDFLPLEVTLWNIVMRFILFQIVVVLTDRIRADNLFFPARESLKSPEPTGSFAEHWAVIVTTGLFFAGVVLIDCLTSPQTNLLPLYLLPCIVLTLVIDRRWGSAAAIITSVTGPFTMRFEAAYYQHFTVEFWNTLTRLIVFQLVVWLLDRIRRHSVLFYSHEAEDKSAGHFSAASETEFLPSK
jgi:hypothetical protein